MKLRRIEFSFLFSVKKNYFFTAMHFKIFIFRFLHFRKTKELDMRIEENTAMTDRPK